MGQHEAPEAAVPIFPISFWGSGCRGSSEMPLATEYFEATGLERNVRGGQRTLVKSPCSGYKLLDLKTRLVLPPPV